MILACYRARYWFREDEWFKGQEILEEYLGYSVVRCFAANGMREFITNSIIAPASNPEVLYLFEAKEYVPFDVVKWNRFLYEHGSLTEENRAQLADCFVIEDEKYCEYLVKDIVEDGFYQKLDIHQLMYDTQIDIIVGDNEDDGMVEEELSEVFMDMCRSADLFVDVIFSNPRMLNVFCWYPDEELKRIAVEKNAFEVYLSPAMMSALLPGQHFVDFLTFRPNTYVGLFEFLWFVISENYDGECEPTYERQDKILELLDACFVSDEEC